MAKAKKFGTFSGVFTPSILTILGVIMYLRFPAIIGQAGLINTIGIIVIAHIISITTSLSVASLSTDKPVQNGGTYFMISRSLGLPIGGTLGLALFVGLSFSVSLYLIGFAESFLQYWGMEVDINTIRITGSIVLLAVTTITFISTSLAIKSQYFIMAAIVLSLFSIFFGKHDFKPEAIHLAPLATAAPFMVLFGIFFPAVTGFEAGVSMSGDLKDPRKSLPTGAMLAVGVGFIVYIGLALFYSFTVDANALVNDPQILFKISLVPALVIAGIWGATLSSALGSILGAPRILQAIAMDKIVPFFFAKGTGKTNEPRNALLLAFVIAEAGILVGKLDVIARVVSMFFITTYGFLNMASAIESWSSSDFRPAFKIPRFVSILGTLSAFIVMILLDFLALAGATLVLGLLYFFLQRKELILESGDAWSSFWTNLAKKSLLRLSVKKDNKRNWRPNIILFSGGEKSRPHLVGLGKALTGKLGALTDFNLTIGEENMFPVNNSTTIQNEDKNRGYFVRELNCKTLPEGIKTVTNIYGFSGFEPNTVLLGWSKKMENFNFLSEIITDLKTKGLNAIFLDYDKNNGFGKKENIDIWWNGKGAHLSFSLNILRFLLSDPSWRDARVRILIINSDTSLEDSLYRNTNAILQDKRIQAEIKIINDDFGSRKTEDIIQRESEGTDLILIGIAKKYSIYTQEYIEKMNAFCKLPSSILLLSPSYEFEEINLIERLVSKSTIEIPLVETELSKLPEINNKIIKIKIENLDNDLMLIGKNFYTHYIKDACQQLQALISNVQELSSKIFISLQKELTYSVRHEYPKVIDKHQISYLKSIVDIARNENIKHINEAEIILQKGISSIIIKLGNYIYETADSISIPYILHKNQKEKIIEFPFRRSVSHYCESKIKPVLHEQFLIFEENSKIVFTELRNMVLTLNDKLEKIELEKENINTSIEADFQKILEDFDLHKKRIELTETNFVKLIMSSFREISIELANSLVTPESLKRTKNNIKLKTKNYDEELNTFSETWSMGMHLLNNAFYIDTLVLSKEIIFKNVILKGNRKISEDISNLFFIKQNKLIENLKAITINPHGFIEPIPFSEQVELKKILNETYEKAALQLEDLPEEYFLPKFIIKESKFIPFDDYEQFAVNLYKSANYYIDVLFYEPLYREVENLELALRKAIIESKEANSMLLFYLNNTQNDVSDNYNIETDISLFKKLLRQIEAEKAKVETVLGRINHFSESYLSEAFSKLFSHSVIDASKNFHVDEQNQRKGGLSFLKLNLFKRLKSQVKNLLINILNTTSSGILLSKKLLEVKSDGVQTKEILDLIDKLLPDRRNYSFVPVFYRNLLSSSSKITDEFWISRKEDMLTIKEALYRHRKGLGGAVFITGVHGAGKTTLSRYAVNHLFKSQNIIWVNAPASGSTNPDDLLLELKKYIGGFNDFPDFFNNLPHETALVINDLELWWERRPDGGEVIEQLIELIKRYSQKVFFIININVFSYNLMRQLYPLNDYNLATVHCNPFNSQELQQMILQRHKSSGVSLIYRGKEEESISQLTYSVLFSRYFNLSEGIPGVAINLWKANIRSINNDSIEIKKPKKINHDILHDLSKNWLVVLTLFIHHKNIDAGKLTRVTGMSLEKSTELLFTMANSGLIVKKSQTVYTLGRNVEPFIVEVCKTKGLI